MVYVEPESARAGWLWRGVAVRCRRDRDDHRRGRGRCGDRWSAPGGDRSADCRDSFMDAESAPRGCSEMLRRVLGFRLYIDTAEKDRQQFNERADIFATYLPYAIVFGCAEKWARVFRRSRYHEGRIGRGTREASAMAPSVSLKSPSGVLVVRRHSINTASINVPAGHGSSGFSGAAASPVVWWWRVSGGWRRRWRRAGELVSGPTPTTTAPHVAHHSAIVCADAPLRDSPRSPACCRTRRTCTAPSILPRRTARYTDFEVVHGRDPS